MNLRTNLPSLASLALAGCAIVFAIYTNATLDGRARAQVALELRALELRIVEAFKPDVLQLYDRMAIHAETAAAADTIEALIGPLVRLMDRIEEPVPTRPTSGK